MPNLSRRDAEDQQGKGELFSARTVMQGFGSARAGRAGHAMAAQIAAMQERIARMTPAQIHKAASQLQSEARERGLWILESLAAQMAAQMGRYGGRGTARAYLEVMAQVAQVPDEGAGAQRAEAWLALAALRLGH